MTEILLIVAIVIYVVVAWLISLLEFSESVAEQWNKTYVAIFWPLLLIVVPIMIWLAPYTGRPR
jgi:cytochrome bd-type quinol oxidase subunit 2